MRRVAGERHREVPGLVDLRDAGRRGWSTSSIRDRFEDGARRRQVRQSRTNVVRRRALGSLDRLDLQVYMQTNASWTNSSATACDPTKSTPSRTTA